VKPELYKVNCKAVSSCSKSVTALPSF